jgi:hypothetical protein
MLGAQKASQSPRLSMPFDLPPKVPPAPFDFLVSSSLRRAESVPQAANEM